MRTSTIYIHVNQCDLYSKEPARIIFLRTSAVNIFENKCFYIIENQRDLYSLRTSADYFIEIQHGLTLYY